MLDFDGRVAIVTGAGRGLGRSHALLLASRGAAVVVADVGGAISGEGNSSGPADEVVAEITAAGGRAVVAVESVAESDGGERIVQRAIDEFGRIDIVVNNAGIVRDRTFAKLSDDDIAAVIGVHLIGAFNVTRPAWTHMREQGYGRIVNTTSNSGLLGNFGQSNYGAAKMGLVGMTRVLAVEGAKYGITINAVAPVARTRMTEELFGATVEHFDPALVSSVVAWLSHEDCPANGEIFSAIAGRVARFFVGLTPGYFEQGLTPEAVRDNFDTICDVEGFTIPENALREIEDVHALLAREGLV